MKGPLNYCLSQRMLLLNSNKLEHVLLGYIVPFLFLFGITGNTLNLCVLLSSSNRGRLWLLSYLAVSDIVFLMFILPHSLANYELFVFDRRFRYYYLSYKPNITAIANWASALSTWIILWICCERLIRVRYPLFIRRYALDTSLSRSIIITILLVMTGLLTAYIHISYDTQMKLFCNGTQPHALQFPVDSPRWMKGSALNRQWLREIVVWNTRLHEIFVVFIPLLVILIANIMLLITLKKRTAHCSQCSPHSLLFLSKTKDKSLHSAASNRSDQPITSVTRIDQNITCSICAIVTCFTLTQAPSGFVSAIFGYRGANGPEWKDDLIVITNFLVVVGKSINFVLFCLTSATFRRRLVSLIKKKFSSDSESSTLAPRTCSTTVAAQLNSHRATNHSENRNQQKRI